MVETTCFGLSASNKNVCSGNGNCTYLNFCECFDGFDGNECQSLTAIDIRDVMFGFSITGPILAVIISILLCIPFIVYVVRRRKAEKARKASSLTAANADNNSAAASDRVMRFNGRGRSNTGDDIQRSPTHSYAKPSPFGRSYSERTDRSDDILIGGKSKSPSPTSKISSFSKQRKELSKGYSASSDISKNKKESDIDELNQV